MCDWCTVHEHTLAHGMCVHAHRKAGEGLEAPVAAVVEHKVLLLARRDGEVAGVREHACTVGHRGVLDTVAHTKTNAQHGQAVRVVSMPMTATCLHEERFCAA